MGDFTMPSLGADMAEGTLQEWLVHPGDQVRKGDIVAVVDTAKSLVDVECFESGTVAELLVEPGTTVPVGTPLAVIEPSSRPPGAAPRGDGQQPPRPAPEPTPSPGGTGPAPEVPPAPRTGGEQREQLPAAFAHRAGGSGRVGG
ncbi:biotin/lipoyl-containing protein, partial [Streptomyces beihaiensis]